MANIKYRSSTTPTVPVSTTAKGTPLTNDEIDGNFKSVADELASHTSSISTANANITELQGIVDVESDTTTNATVYPVWTTAIGRNPYKISTTKLRYNPNTDTLTVANINGTATNVLTNANLSGMVTSVGNTTTVVTNAALTGEATSDGITNAVTLTNSAVIGKVLTGFTSGVGTVTATDTILQAIQKLAANDGVNAAMTGEATSNGSTNTVTLTNSAVIGKVLTGYTKGAGTVAATDSILQAIQKLDANDDLKAPLASPTFTGTPIAPTAAADTNTTQLATTAYVLGQASSANPTTAGTAASAGTSAKYARGDHVHKDVRPAFRAYRGTSTQSLSSGVDATVQFQTKSFDTGTTLYDTTLYRWTPAITGYYQVNASVNITGTSLTQFIISVLVSGNVYSTKTVNFAASAEQSVEISDCIQLSNTDYVTIVVNVTGTSPVVQSGATKTYFSGSLVSIGS